MKNKKIKNLWVSEYSVTISRPWVDQEKELYIGFTQENSIENSVQDYLSYILKAHSLCSITLALLNNYVFSLRSTYVKHAV